MSENKFYYKIVENLPRIGKTIYTNRKFDRKRIKRQKKLDTFFELIYTYSINKNIPVAAILNEISPYQIPTAEDYEIDNILVIKLLEEVNKNKFQWLNEERFFYDFVLTKAKKKIEKEKIEIFPDRFKSHYFFENLNDCYEYMRYKGNGNIIKVKVLNEIVSKKLDNKLSNTFKDDDSAEDLLKQAEFYLLGGVSINPIYEIIFQGKYKIISYH